MSDSRTLREIKFHPHYTDEEWSSRISIAHKWLGAGDAVAVSVYFRGRQIVGWEASLPLLARFAEELSAVASIADPPQLIRPRLTMRLVPK